MSIVNHGDILDHSPVSIDSRALSPDWVLLVLLLLDISLMSISFLRMIMHMDIMGRVIIRQYFLWDFFLS